MTTQDAFNQAINALSQAAQARKLEVDNLRKEIDAKDQSLKNHVNELRQNEASTLKQAAQTDSSSLTATQEQKALLMKNEESQLQDQFTKFKRDADQSLSQMQQNINDINQTIQTIQRSWLTI